MSDGQNNKRMSMLRELQLEQLDLIRLFANICERENLIYYMLDGTMLGAIRHKGYIPWDDDADFGMPRSDYERFLTIAGKYMDGPYNLIANQNEDNEPQYQARLVNTERLLRIDLSLKSRITNLWIDIFPLDGMPNNVLLRQYHKVRLLYRRAMYKFSFFDEYVAINKPNRVWYERLLIFIGKNIHVEKLLSKCHEREELEKALKSYSYSSSNYIFNMMSAYKFKEMFRKEVFGEGALYEFEGISLRGPRDYDLYLRKLYGDYMTPPPESERNHHGTTFLEKEQ